MHSRALHATAAALLLVVSAGCAGLPLADPATESPTDASAPRAAAPGTVEPGSTPADGPRATPTPTATPRPTPDVTVDERVAVEGGSLPVNASLVFARVEALLGVNVSAPGVSVSNESGTVTSPGPPPAPFLAFGATVEGGRLASCGAIATGAEIDGNVRVGVGGLSESQVELLLVHEFVHVVQGQVESLSVETAERTNDVIDDAIEEGGAVYLTHLYASRYGNSWGNRSVLSLRRCFYRRAGDDVRVFAGWYYFGAMHFVRRLDGSRNLSRVYAAPPRTTEQLVHGLAPGTEPPATLSVTVDGSDPDQRERKGELRLRTMLVSALPPDRAAAAAEGWGNDTLLSFYGDDGSNFAWVIRFDDAGEAGEFTAAFREYESRVEQRGDAHVRLARVSPETVVLFAGSREFVGDASASGTNGTVTVRVPDGAGAVASASTTGPGPLLVPVGVGVTERGLS